MSVAAVVAWPLAQLRHSAIPPQAVLGGALLTGLATATVLGKMKGKGGKRPGIFRKTALFVRQPTLFVGGTLLFIYPQYFAQQLGLRTHKPAPAGGALPPASPKPDPAAQAELNEQKLLEAAEAAAAKARAAAEAAEAAERREQDAAAEAARAKAEKNARAQEQAEHRRQEAARVQAEEAARAQQEAEEETLRKLRAKEAEERRRQEAAAAAAAARQQEQERADAAAASAAKKEEEEEQARQAEAARVKAEAEAARLKAEAEAQAAADEAAARAAAEEQEAQAREAEAARRKQEAEAQAAADALADITKRTKAKGDEVNPTACPIDVACWAAFSLRWCCAVQIRAAKRSRASRQVLRTNISAIWLRWPDDLRYDRANNRRLGC